MGVHTKPYGVLIDFTEYASCYGYIAFMSAIVINLIFYPMGGGNNIIGIIVLTLSTVFGPPVVYLIALFFHKLLFARIYFGSNTSVTGRFSDAKNANFRLSDADQITSIHWTSNLYPGIRCLENKDVLRFNDGKEITAHGPLGETVAKHVFMAIVRHRTVEGYYPLFNKVAECFDTPFCGQCSVGKTSLRLTTRCKSEEVNWCDMSAIYVLRKRIVKHRPDGDSDDCGNEYFVTLTRSEGCRIEWTFASSAEADDHCDALRGVISQNLIDLLMLFMDKHSNGKPIKDIAQMVLGFVGSLSLELD